MRYFEPVAAQDFIKHADFGPVHRRALERQLRLGVNNGSATQGGENKNIFHDAHGALLTFRLRQAIPVRDTTHDTCA